MSSVKLNPAEKDPFKLVFAINQLIEGRSDAVGTVTLTANVTTTTVSAPTCGPSSKIFLYPTTANAAGAVATTYIKVADVTARQFIVTHANAVSTDRTFFWVALG